MALALDSTIPAAENKRQTAPIEKEVIDPRLLSFCGADLDLFQLVPSDLALRFHPDRRVLLFF
jgi:hypothetical protein